jgi:hypothetical protein
LAAARTAGRLRALAGFVAGFLEREERGEYWENADCVEVIDRPDTAVDAEAFRAVLKAVWSGA